MHCKTFDQIRTGLADMCFQVPYNTSLLVIFAPYGAVFVNSFDEKPSLSREADVRLLVLTNFAASKQITAGQLSGLLRLYRERNISMADAFESCYDQEELLAALLALLPAASPTPSPATSPSTRQKRAQERCVGTL